MKLSDHLGLEYFSSGAYAGAIQPEHFLVVLDGIGAEHIAHWRLRHKNGTIQGEADGYPISYAISCQPNGDGRLRIWTTAHWARENDPVLFGSACFYWKEGGPESRALLARIIATMEQS